MGEEFSWGLGAAPCASTTPAAVMANSTARPRMAGGLMDVMRFRASAYRPSAGERNVKAQHAKGRPDGLQCVFRCQRNSSSNRFNR